MEFLAIGSPRADVTAANATLDATENEGNLNGIRLQAPNSAHGKSVEPTVTSGGDSETVKRWVPEASVTRGSLCNAPGVVSRKRQIFPAVRQAIR